jgi:type VI secretion system protein ImpB
MDGKSGAEDLIGKLLKDPALLAALGSTPKQADATAPQGNEEKSDG